MEYSKCTNYLACTSLSQIMLQKLVMLFLYMNNKINDSWALYVRLSIIYDYVRNKSPLVVKKSVFKQEYNILKRV